MQNATKPGLWAQTPPAIFPPLLGLLSLGLAWRRGADVFGIPRSLGELVLGGVTLLFLFAVLAYLAKVVRRPGALVDDLRILPGRAGLSTASMSGMLLGAVMVPYNTCAATVILVLAVAAHALIAFIVIVILAPAPLVQRRITPVWHLTFVGFIVVPLAAIPLGAGIMSEVILVLTISMAITIWASHAYLVSRSGVPAPLRPTLAIHLAPLCLFGIVTGMLGFVGLSAAIGWLSILGLVLLISRAAYLTTAGFSPFWGAFTFPMAAFVNLMLLLSDHVAPFRLIGGIALVLASLAIFWIAYKIMKMWASGSLGAKTNASKL